MEYQKNLLHDTKNQTSKFRTRIWVEINDEPRDDNNNDENNNNNDDDDNNNIKFKKLMIRSSLCGYTDAYTLAKGTRTVPNTAAAGAAENNANKKN